eukprot:168687_1
MALDLSGDTSRLVLYLDDILVQLNDNQITQIMELIQAQVQCHEIENDAGNQTVKEIFTHGTLFEYVFEVNDTFFHSMFGDITAEKIKQIVDHKLMLTFIVVLGCLSVLLGNIFIFPDEHKSSTINDIFGITFFGLIVIPWFIFKHLMLNQVAFKLCIQSFDYWIKVGYGLIGSCASLFHAQPVWNGFTLLNIRKCFGNVVFVLGISYFSSFDAEHSNRRKQLFMALCGALFLSWKSFQSQFLLKDEDDTKFIINLSNGVNVISTQSFIASATRIVCIFFWRQSYRAWRSKGRALSISTAPILTWIATVSQKDNTVISIKNNVNGANAEQQQQQEQNEEMEIPTVTYRQKVPETVAEPGNLEKDDSLSVMDSLAQTLTHSDSD